MQANPAKFQYIHTSTSTDIPYKYNNVILSSEESVKLLGISIDKKLSFSSHVNTIIQKCANQLNILRRKSKMLNTKTELLIV
jgi:hypothetical protein